MQTKRNISISLMKSGTGYFWSVPTEYHAQRTQVLGHTGDIGSAVRAAHSFVVEEFGTQLGDVTFVLRSI
jgi:hypothetical protein